MLIGRYTAFLDGSVMRSAFLRTALLNFAAERLFIPAWSDHVFDEVRQELISRGQDAEIAKNLVTALTKTFPDVGIPACAKLAGCNFLDDPKHNLTLACAIVGKCSGIITSDRRSFPAEITDRFQLEIIHPDDFVVNIIDLDVARALPACAKHRASMAAPVASPEEYLGLFEMHGLIQSHERLKAHVELF